MSHEPTDAALRRLADYRLIFLGSASGTTAVSDYCDNFFQAVKPYFADAVDYRMPGPTSATLADIRRDRKAVRDLVAQGPRDRTLVHAELTTGAMGPFWSLAGLKDVLVTGTVHDPPQGLWYFAGTKFVMRYRLLRGVIHVPLLPLSRAIEGAVYRDKTLFALTEAGRRSVERAFPHTRALYVPHIAYDRPSIRPAQDRPKAVGLFGYAYRGKGFEQVARIRELLPDDITIRIAGRGTQDLPAGNGIEVLGAVYGPDEDAFFDSVRAIVMPYGRRHWATHTFPASGVAASAQAYGTPLITTGYGPLSELDESTGATSVQPSDESDGVATALANEIELLVNDRKRLTQLGLNAVRTGKERSQAGTGRAFAEAWSQLVQHSVAGV